MTKKKKKNPYMQMNFTNDFKIIPVKPFEMKMNVDWDHHPKSGKPMWDSIDCKPLDPRHQDILGSLKKVVAKTTPAAKRLLKGTKKITTPVAKKLGEKKEATKKIAKEISLRTEKSIVNIIGRNREGVWRLLAENVLMMNIDTAMAELARRNPDIVKTVHLSTNTDWRRDIEIRTAMASKEPWKKMLHPDPSEQVIRKKVKGMHEAKSLIPGRSRFGAAPSSRPYTKGWYGAATPPKQLVRPRMIQRTQVQTGSQGQPVRVQTTIQEVAQQQPQAPMQVQQSQETGFLQAQPPRKRPWAVAPKTGLVIYRGMGKEEKYTPPVLDYREY